MSEAANSKTRHFTLRQGFAVLVGLLILALYFLWAAYGAAPKSLSFLTETPAEPAAVTPMARMYRGQPAALPAGRIFGITSLVLG